MSLKQLSIATLLLIAAATPAMAHPGHHEEMSFWTSVSHLFGSLDHLTTLGVIAVVVGFGGRVLWRRLSKSS